jgi:selenide,water dikinase
VSPSLQNSSRIAASNALSDIFARGGEPIAADILLELPRNSTDVESLAGVIVGEMKDVLASAGVRSVGGHTSLGIELRLGAAITGLTTTARLRSTDTADVGDVLVISKPTGTGLVYTGYRLGLVRLPTVAHVDDVTMTTNAAAASLLDGRCRCSTDVTGFGVLGAAAAIAQASDVTVVLETDAIPVIPEAVALAGAGALSHIGEATLFELLPVVDAQVPLETQLLLSQPETSGGLLASVDPGVVDSLADVFTPIGVIEPSGSKSVVLR